MRFGSYSICHLTLPQPRVRPSPQVRVWDANASWHEVIELPGHDAIVWMCAWSPDGTRLASVSSDQTVILWNPYTGREVGRLEGHDAGVFACAWSPDGMRVATASRDTTVRVWDVATRRQVATLEGHTDAVRAVAWSPGGIASGSLDSTVRVWWVKHLIPCPHLFSE